MDSVGWGQLAFVVFGWVASPLVGCVVSGACFIGIEWLVLDRPDAAARSERYQGVFLALAITNGALFIVLKGPPMFKVRPYPLATLVAMLIGCVLSAIAMAAKAKGLFPGAQGGASGSETMSSSLVSEGGQQPAVVEEAGSFDAEKDASSRMTVSTRATEDKELTDVEKPFVPLLVVSALSVAFAHGGNDVGNAVGPLASLVEVYSTGAVAGQPEVMYWELMIGAAGFVVGIMLLGDRTIEKVGSGLCKNLNPPKAFAMQTGAAIAVLGSSAFKLPVSTSHCLVRFLHITTSRID